MSETILNVVKFPDRDLRNIPTGLRALADGIERGDYGDAFNMVWIVDTGRGSSGVECGLLGESPEPGATAHLLCAIAQRKLEGAIK